MTKHFTNVLKIKTRFSSIIGRRIYRIETAELKTSNEQWERWDDLPIRIYTDPNDLIAIAWSKFDDLWLANDLSLPFEPGECSLRWVSAALPIFDPAIGATIRSVKLGRGEMSIEWRDIEIWTRLMIQVDECWLEIFNAFDENGYAFHDALPEGEFLPCF